MKVTITVSPVYEEEFDLIDFANDIARWAEHAYPDVAVEVIADAELEEPTKEPDSHL